MDIIKVNGVVWPKPDMDGYQVIEQPNVAPGAARDAATADLLADFVAYVGQLVVPYSMLSNTQIKSMYDSLAPHQVTVQFFNHNNGTVQTQGFYFDQFLSTFAAGDPAGKYWVKDVVITFTGTRGYQR